MDKSELANSSEHLYEKPCPANWGQWLKLFFAGMCIGAADIVPGVSGGTVAFIIGIYENLLNSLKTLNLSNTLFLIRGKVRFFFQQIAWQYLTAVVGGMVVSLVTLSSLFNAFLKDEQARVFLYATFLGLVLGSVYYCAKQVKVWRLSRVCSFFFGALIAFYLCGTNFTPRGSELIYDIYIPSQQIPLNSQALIAQNKIKNYQANTSLLLDVPESYIEGMLAKKYITDKTLVYSHHLQRQGILTDLYTKQSSGWLDMWIVLCGILAVSAMLLPGISGSYMLTILGVYGTVLGGLVDWVEGIRAGIFDIDAFRIVLSMSIGILIGASLFSRVISWLLAHYKETAIALLTGFMIGALRVIWPFWAYSYVLMPLKLQEGAVLQPVAPMLPDITSPIFLYANGFLIMGIFLVVLLECVSNRKRC